MRQCCSVTKIYCVMSLVDLLLFGQIITKLASTGNQSLICKHTTQTSFIYFCFISFNFRNIHLTNDFLPAAIGWMQHGQKIQSNSFLKTKESCLLQKYRIRCPTRGSFGDCRALAQIVAGNDAGRTYCLPPRSAMLYKSKLKVLSLSQNHFYFRGKEEDLHSTLTFGGS